ncbi:unnamed protein product [Amoebophrya sp. A25]|nr:unnamed protein product [Amoebophrya sp. A25]|eukprot:GSA25T00018638001.1
MGANCSTSCALGCYVCVNRCQLDDVRNRFSFLPPDPASYAIRWNGRTASLELEFLLPELEAHPIYRRARGQARLFQLKTERGNLIVTAYIRPGRRAMLGLRPLQSPPMLQQMGDGKDGKDSGEGQGEGGQGGTGFSGTKLVVLHCHGNATDMGMMLPVYCDLAEALDVDVCAVEYSGYGPPRYRFRSKEKVMRESGVPKSLFAEQAGGSSSSTASNKKERHDVVEVFNGVGVADSATVAKEVDPASHPRRITPSFRHVTADALAAYRWLVDEHGVDPNRIILYGQSVGTGPILDLATKVPCAGVVLHSAMLSGIQVLDPNPQGACKPSSTFRCVDLFLNGRNIRKLGVKTLLIHGRADRVVPFEHSRKLFELIPEDDRYPPYFPQQAGHNDLVEVNPFGYFQALARFFSTVIPDYAKKPGGGSGAGQLTTLEEPLVDTMRGGTAGPEDGRYEDMRGGAAQQGLRKVDKAAAN